MNIYILSMHIDSKVVLILLLSSKTHTSSILWPLQLAEDDDDDDEEDEDEEEEEEETLEVIEVLADDE